MKKVNVKHLVDACSPEVREIFQLRELRDGANNLCRWLEETMQKAFSSALENQYLTHEDAQVYRYVRGWIILESPPQSDSPFVKVLLSLHCQLKTVLEEVGQIQFSLEEANQKLTDSQRDELIQLCCAVGELDTLLNFPD